MEKALDFLRSHAGSLKHLELWDVTFSKGDTWAGFTDWLRVWHDSSLMQLDECCIYSTSNMNHRLGMPLGDVVSGSRVPEVTSEALKVFLRGYGENPFDEPGVVPQFKVRGNWLARH